MKCDVVFSRLKRFKFEKIKKNEFRPTMAKLVDGKQLSYLPDVVKASKGLTDMFVP